MSQPKSKTMWAILHRPSNTWDHGHSNELLYWAEHEAALECRKLNAGSKEPVWTPIQVMVTVR